MRNAKKNNYLQATIQLDKLVMCCLSTVEDNFNDAIKYYPEESLKPAHTFGKTVLTQTIDKNRRYKYSYNVCYAGYHIGRLDFCVFGQPNRDEQIWFIINNMTFYNGTLQFLPQIFSDLNMKLNNITRMEIAHDSYNHNHEQVLRRNIRNADNLLKIMGRNVKDRKVRTSKIKYWNYGSPDNPFQVRTIYIQNERLVNYPKKKEDDKNIDTEPNKKKKTNEKKSTIELAAYNKLEEIKDFSPHKTYILDYHKAHNPNFKNIHRAEIRLESEEIRRYEKKHKKPITLDNLLNKEFLYAMFCEYVDRIIVIRDSKKRKIDLYPVPCLESWEGKLPLPLPKVCSDTQIIENKEINNFISNNDFEKEIYETDTIYSRIIINNQSNNISIYENRQKLIRSNQTKNQQFIERDKESKFWETPFTPTQRQDSSIYDKVLGNY